MTIIERIPLFLVFAAAPIVAVIISLWLTSLIFRLKDTSFKTAFNVMIIVGPIAALSQLFILFSGPIFFYKVPIPVLLVASLLALWLIKRRYFLEWKKTVLLWLVWIVFSLILSSFLTTMFAFVGLVTGIIGA